MGQEVIQWAIALAIVSVVTYCYFKQFDNTDNADLMKRYLESYHDLF